MKLFRSWAICLAFLPLGPASAQTPAQAPANASAQAPANAPSPPAPVLTAPVLTGSIAHISIVGLKNIGEETVRAALALKVGDVYTPQAAQKDADAIQGMGVFQAATAAATPAATGGVDLTYTVSENPVVQDIKFTDDTPTGLPSVPTADLIAQMKTATGQVMNTKILTSDLDRLFNHNTGYYLKRGFLADVDPSFSVDPASGILTVPLKECRIQSIEVSGNSHIKTSDILAQIHTKVDDVFSNDALLQDSSLLYETGQLRTVTFNWNTTKPGGLNLKLSVVEQPAATGILDEKQGKVIPFLYDPLTAALPVIQVSVNGHPPLPFILDTGSSAALSLNPWAAQELGLKASGKAVDGGGFTYTKLPIHGVILQGVRRSNDIAFPTAEAYVLNLSFLNQFVLSQHIAGIVGLGMLLPVTSRFDFAAKTVTIFTQKHPPLSVPSGTVLPLRGTSDGLFTVRSALAPETSADLIVDTGSDSTQIPLSALSVLHPAALAFNSFDERIDGTYFCPEARLPSLTLGELHISDVVAGTLPPPTSLSLGLDILAGYRFTLDGPNGQLIMEPSAHGGRYVLGWSAVDVKQISTKWVVDSLRDGSPAQRAGLQAGDEVVAIRGVPVQGLSQVQIDHLLAGIAGVSLPVQVQRGQSKPMAISWVPEDSFSAPASLLYGLSMQKLPQASWSISNVLTGCIGDLAGLKAGDKIVQLNGESVVSMPLDHFEGLIKSSLISFGVERPGVTQPLTVRLTAPK